MGWRRVLEAWSTGTPLPKPICEGMSLSGTLVPIKPTHHLELCTRGVVKDILKVWTGKENHIPGEQ